MVFLAYMSSSDMCSCSDNLLHSHLMVSRAVRQLITVKSVLKTVAPPSYSSCNSWCMFWKHTLLSHLKQRELGAVLLQTEENEKLPNFFLAGLSGRET